MLEKAVSNTDCCGRLLRHLWAELYPQRPGLELVNEEIGRAGYATVATYPADAKYVDRFLVAERYARDTNLGLWAACPTEGQPPAPEGNCEPSYPTICIPLPRPDLDCPDIPRRNFSVLPPDEHGFYGDHDGIGCGS